MKRLKYTYHLLTTLALLMMSLGGCVQDENLPSHIQEETEETRTTLLLSISMPTVQTKANLTELPGTDKENLLKRITLFLIGDGGVKTYTLPVNEPQSPLTFYIANESGTRQIYAAANMTDAQIAAVKGAADRNPVIDISNIADITGDNGFLMTAQATDENLNKNITIRSGTINRAQAKLDRVMSKVLLTCVTDDNSYIQLSAESKGYIKLSDVRYALETTNRKFFPFTKAGNEDPNYSMTATLGQAPGNFFTYQGSVETDGNIATKHDAGRMSNGSGNPYTEGIYCLENTSNSDYGFGNDLSIPKSVATYLKIAAKFTPKYIDDTNELGETQAKAKLAADGTFYTCRKAPTGYKHICYSSVQAGIAFFNGLGYTFSAEDFIAHTGGWQYYETFVSSPVSFTEEANLKRNHYYIVNVTSMTAPVQEKTIEVNTTIADWIVKGKTTIEIETNN